MVRLLREKFIGREREGSALISVVIGVLFIAAIGVIILTAANQYFISVSVEHNSSNNFYEAEKILEEVKTGLLEYAGDAAATAYRDVLENYSDEETKNSKRTLFSRKYFSLLAKELLPESAGAFDWENYDVGDIRRANIDKLKVLATEPGAVKTNAANVDKEKEIPFSIEQDANGEYSFVIHNLLIDSSGFENDSDYRNTIQTDIRLTVPDYSLEGNSTFDEMKDYISISDDMLEMASTGTNAHFLGNIYSGNRLINGDGKEEIHDQGIKLNPNSSADFKSSMIVSRGDLEIHNGVKTSLSGESGAGELYLKNIHLTGDEESTKKTELKLMENAYIANDLNIESNSATVTLGGKYYGYSYNENNVIATPTSGPGGVTVTPAPLTSEFSSAILINGYDTTLEADNLSSLVLAGRAFVSRAYKGQEENAVKTVSDIMMGESIAVKSNQLAYLVPDDYIISDRWPSGEAHNPVLKSELESGSVRVDVKGLKERFGDYLAFKEFDDYLKKNNLTYDNFDPDQCEDILPYESYYNNGDVGYVFFYLKFADGESANKYFEEYYNGSSKDEDDNDIINKDELHSRGKVYIRDTERNMKFDETLYLVAGNVVNNYYGKDGTTLQSPTYFGDNQEVSDKLLADGIRMGKNYVGRQLRLTPSASTDTMRLSAGEDGKIPDLVEDNIVDFKEFFKDENLPDSATQERMSEKLSKVIDGAGVYIHKETSYDVSTAMKGLLIVNGKVNVKNNFTGLLIANGDVTVSSDFTGLILTTGKVEVEGNLRNLQSDMITVGKIFDFIRTDDNLRKLFYELNGAVTKQPDNLEDCLTYENWMKNEE